MIEERVHLLPLAEHGFELAEISFPRVYGLGCVPVRTNLYSVPVKPGRTVEVRLYPSYLAARDEGRCIARHERCYQRQQQVLDLEHYLDVLERRAGAKAGRAGGIETARGVARTRTVAGELRSTARRRIKAPGSRTLVLVFAQFHIPASHLALLRW